MVKIHSHKQRDRDRVVQQESSVVQLLNSCPVCPMRLFYGYNLIFCLCFIVALVQNVHNFIKPGNVMLSVLGIEIENANHAHTIINMRRAIKWSPTHHNMEYPYGVILLNFEYQVIEELTSCFRHCQFHGFDFTNKPNHSAGFEYE